MRLQWLYTASKELFTREKDTHKNNYGHVLVIAGSRGMPGAAILVSRAALRAGAGLVSVCAPREICNTVVSATPECMTLPIETKTGHLRDNGNVAKIFEFIERRKIKSIVIGPGMSLNDAVEKFVVKFFSFPKQKYDIPCVIDADALTILSHGEIPLSEIKFSSLVLTPHIGELARLLKVAVEELKDRERRELLAKQYAKENKIILVVKGYRTIITDGNDVYKNTTGNPGMATAGSGDVLSGILGGLLAQVYAGNKKIAVYDVVKLGVHLHGLAGDIAAKKYTETALISTDIINFIPEAIKHLTNFW
jgi:hydroxyethylthiazole kinase-like uncharacterized protein yjeF